MKLILRLADASQPGHSRSLETGTLSIGRGSDNSWVLADPDRTLSKNHCRIDASEGGFMLTDLSTNGVFLAGAPQPVGRGHSVALENGDSFSLGPYRMQAEIVGGQADGLNLSAGIGVAQGVSPLLPAIEEPWLAGVPGGEFGPGRRAAPEGWDAPPDPATYAASGTFEAHRAPADSPFNAAGLFSQHAEHIAASGLNMRLPEAQVMLPPNWMDGDPMESLRAKALPAAAPAAWPPVLPEAAPRPVPEPEPPQPPEWAAPVAGGREAPAAAGSTPAPVAAPVAPVAEAGPVAAQEGLLAAFLDGAGLPPETMAGLDGPAALREIGQMVRAAVEGVRDVLSTRALVKSEFRVDQTVLRRNDNNQMKFAPDAQRCLAAMVGAAPPGFLPGPAAMQQSMDDIKLHELALVAALNSVFADMGAQLEPDAIMRRARQDTGMTSMLPYAREAKCWAIFVETYRMLQESGAPNTGGSLLAPLAQAYARQMKRAR